MLWLGTLNTKTPPDRGVKKSKAEFRGGTPLRRGFDRLEFDSGAPKTKEGVWW